MGTVHYRNWYSVVPLLVMAFLHFGLVPVWAYSITVTRIKWCQYRYWHLCILVQYHYRHIPLLVLALNGASTGIGICAIGPVPVLAGYITGTGIKWCLYQYWHFFTFVQYQYGYRITGTGIKWYQYR
jgi:hypothetical protein